MDCLLLYSMAYKVPPSGVLILIAPRVPAKTSLGNNGRHDVLIVRWGWVTRILIFGPLFTVPCRSIRGLGARSQVHFCPEAMGRFWQSNSVLPS